LATLALIVALTLSRFVLAALVGLGDVEAYYWVWAQHLDWSYFDHGPLVAWTIAASTTLFGDGSFGVRALFIAQSAATMGLVAWVAARLSAHRWRAAFVAVTALCCLPMFIIAGAAANPDGPQLLATMVCLAALLRAQQRQPSAPQRQPTSMHWLTLAAFAGGAATSAKLFGALLLLPAIAVCWRAPRRLRALAATLSGFFLGAAPVLWWNVNHKWATVSYHLAGRHSRPAGPSLENLGKLIGGQLAYVGPLTLVGLLFAAAWLWRRRASDDNARLLLWSALPLLAAGTLLILIVPGAEPHWPAAGYLPLLAAFAHWLLSRWSSSRRLRGLSWAALGLAAITFVAFQLHVATDLGVRLMPQSYVPRYDLANELYGWPQVARAVGRARLALRRASPKRTVAAAACHYTSCSQLRYAARGVAGERASRFEVLCPSPRADQYDLLPGGDGSQRRGIDLIYVLDERFPFAAETLYHCASTRTLERIAIRRGGRVVRRFALELCRDFGGLRATRWPPRGTKTRASAQQTKE
jgi:4-amino-4-deoxy-L-arabinose transferase-like glycosyltransferase